jgi:5-(hydroxymethyl)furfural/furfural oxidase
MPDPYPDSPGEPFDVAIVGGGSAGCVLAARLSEDPTRRVLLIEAGRDASEADCPAHALSPYAGYVYFDPALTWAGLQVRFAEGRAPAPYSQGRALGGGSLVNGLGANRGAPADYDEWEALGAAGWGWRNVLPYFRKLERDLECDGDLHGAGGPLPIRRAPAAWRSRFVEAAVETLAKRQIHEKPDQNGPWEDGVFAQKVNLDERMRRAPASLAWLTPAVRRRPNLAIVTGVAAKRIVLQGANAAGVMLDFGGVERFAPAREVIVSAGALHTPALLMRSGIGPAAHLAERGVAVVRDAPGVGANLMEHPYAGIAFHLPAASRMRGDEHHHIPAIWRFSSNHAGCPPGDMHMGFMGRSAWHGIGRRMGALAFWVNKSYSRGAVRLGQAAEGPPEVDMRLLSDERDLARLRDAFRIAAELGAEIARTGAAGPPQPARMSDRARRYGAVTTRNRILTGLAGAAVDLSGPLAAAALGRLTADGPTVAALVADEAALDRYLVESVIGVWHASGTCRMGADGDPLAVADAEGRVRGIGGLRVCDASIFPSIPCANLNVPVLMAAERIADLMRGRT